MTAPTEVAFAKILYSDMAGVPVFAALCGITNVGVNETVETQSRRVRDCAFPNRPGVQKLKVLGTSWTVNGSGLTNADQRAIIKSALFGKKVNYKFEYYADDGTDAGDLLGTDAGLAILNANNMALDQDSDSSLELVFEGEGALTYTPAP